MELENQELEIEEQEDDFEDADLEDDEDLDEDEESEDEEAEAQRAEEEKAREQKKEQNRINAQKRRERRAKKDEELEKKGYNKALKEAVDGVNPYTGKPINDDVDMEMYLTMRELEKKGLDPLSDYAEFVANKSRESRQAETAKKQQEEYATKDIEDFSKVYPDIDVNKLFNDEHFQSFADGKLGTKPLKEVYEKFLQFESYYEQKAEEDSTERVVKKFARTQSAMGSMKNPGTAKKKSYRDMSDEEFEAELKRVKQQTY